MCCKTRWDKIRNGYILHYKDSWGSTYSINIVENRFRWFGQVERKPVDSIVRRVDQIEDSHITRGIGRPRRTIRGCLFQGWGWYSRENMAREWLYPCLLWGWEKKYSWV
jgi:hypothetical protein